MADVESAEGKWLPVIGRSLAYLCLKAEAGEDDGRSLQQRATLLEALGLSRADTASMLGTTVASITELHHQARKKRSVKRGSEKKKIRTAR